MPNTFISTGMIDIKSGIQKPMKKKEAKYLSISVSYFITDKFIE